MFKIVSKEFNLWGPSIFFMLQFVLRKKYKNFFIVKIIIFLIEFLQIRR